MFSHQHFRTWLGSRTFGAAMAVAWSAAVASHGLAEENGDPPPPPFPDPVAGQAPPLAIAESNPEIDTRFNQRQVPGGLEDLQAIEVALAAALPGAMDALVAIEIEGGAGSGVIVSPDGLILSAAHVVMAPGTKLAVRLTDGREFEGETLGLVPDADAGMARILPDPDAEEELALPYVPMGDYNSAQLGQWTFALGHSGGWDEARGGVVRVGRIIRLLGDTLQTDCKLIGGDSGGPLFDMYGRLLGINSRVGGNFEQSLHCPVSVFLDRDEELRRGLVQGQEHPAFLGAATQDAEDGGVELGRLLERGAASRAGLAEGDVLLAAWDVPLANRDDLSRQLERIRAGERVLFTVRRAESGEEEELWVRLGSRTPFRIMGIGEVE